LAITVTFCFPSFGFTVSSSVVDEFLVLYEFEMPVAKKAFVAGSHIGLDLLFAR
jgi:hypothetical protein